ncbi:MAG: SRPBCC family protein [Chloroflexota bacterium]
MKYTVEIEIDLPRENVVALFDDPDNLKKWQPDLVVFEHQSGELGQPGAKSRIVHQMGKREVEMIETIVTRNLPDEFSGTYEAKGVWNKVENRFYELGENKTKWTLDSEFQCTGFMRVMAFLVPGMFKKQTAAFMKQFKDFAEKTGA